jgi:HEPN domain-containing protein
MKKVDLDLAKGLISKAEKDLDLAKLIMEKQDQSDNCGYHLQQAAEKTIKAILILKDVEYKVGGGKGHDMDYLMGLLYDSGFNSLELEPLLALQPYAVQARSDAYEDVETESTFVDLANLIENLMSSYEVVLSKVKKSKK